MIRKYLILGLLTFFIASCMEQSNDLPPVEERVREAIDGLRSELTAPANGWRLEYQPTEESGTFLMLLNFNSDGYVNIQSDVADNNGEFFNHTISYRIDNALSLELILETYAVFHHMFELESATFGAEFEFLFRKKEGDDLIFESKSDISNPTTITFTPAGANDANDFARDVSENFNHFKISNPQIFGTILPTQQVILNDRNISIFWTIDLDKRNLTAEFAGVGTTRNEVISGSKVTLDHFSKYSYSSGKLVLDSPISFGLNGQQHNVSQLTLTDFDLTGPDLCASGGSNTEPKYEGVDPALGAVTVVNSFLSTRGIEFTPTLYQVNAAFIFDAQGNSLQETGSISQKLPGTAILLMMYNVQLNPPYDNVPPYSIGFFMESGEIYVREFQPTTTQINLVQMSLMDQYYYTATPPAGTDQAMKEITDEIFAGGEFYAFDEPVNGLKLFRLYNPCNKYEFFLIQ